MQKVLYKETQISKLIIVTFVTIIIFLMVSTIFQWGNNPLHWITTSILSVLFLTFILLFYKLEIVITDKEASARFGIGLIKNKKSLDNLDLNSVRIIHVPWYAGVGIRITPYGTLYNIQSGKTVHIKTKNGISEFFVGTKNPETLVRILKNLEYESKNI